MQATSISIEHTTMGEPDPLPASPPGSPTGQAQGAPSLSLRLALELRSGLISPRLLRALEYLLLRLCTRPAPEGGPRRLLPDAELEAVLRTLAPQLPKKGAEARASRYHALWTEALKLGSYAQLEERGLLRRARMLKYELGADYLERPVLCEALQCLLMLERLVAEPGFAEDPDRELARWRRSQLPIEPPDGERARGASERLEPARGTAANGADDTARTVVPASMAVGSAARAPAGARRRADLPPSHTEARPVPGPAVSTRGGSPDPATRVRRLHTLGALATLNLGLIAFFSVRLLTTPPAPALEPAGRYVAYQIPTNSGLPLIGARRLDDTLILTADERWLAMPPPARAVLLDTLSRALLKRRGVTRLLVVDRESRQLAAAGPDPR